MKFKIVVALLGASVIAEAAGPVSGALRGLSFSPSIAYATEPAPEPPSAESSAAQVCTGSETLLAAISLERDVLNEQQQKLRDEMAELELARERVKLEVQSLNQLKASIEGIIQRTADMHTKDIERLVNLYQTMKPQEAAKIMDTIDIELAVMVMGSMSERKAAPILARMQTVRAQAISKIMMERSKLPGDQKLNGIKLE